MEEGQIGGGRVYEMPTSIPQEVAIRGSAASSRTFEGLHSHPPLTQSVEAPRRSAGDVWAGAISRLQTQYSLNTSLLEAHRRQLHDVELAVRNLNTEMGNVIHTLNQVRQELRARPIPSEKSRHDPGDLDVLTGQVEAVTAKVNEVDALKMQIELMRNRMRRLEEQTVPVAVGTRPTSGSTHRESSVQEGTPAPMQQPQHLHTHSAHHHSLPPMRTSPMQGRLSGIHDTRTPHQLHPPILPSQGGPMQQSPIDQQQHATESPSIMSRPAAGGFKLAEPLPGLATLAGFRPTQSTYPPASYAARPIPPQVRPPTLESEAQASGWAAVNAAKRPFEEPRPSPYASPMDGSPKRPKLAPIVPKGRHGEDASYVPSSIAQSSGRESIDLRSRAPSDASQSQQSQAVPTPGSAMTSSYRFMGPTQIADSQESWRPEHERMQYPHPHQKHQQQPQQARNRSRRGSRGRGRGGRGGLNVLDSQELGTPDWEKADWTGSQISQNGFYHALHHIRPQEEPTRGGLVRRSGGVAGGPSEREQDVPETPIQGPHDPFIVGGQDGGDLQTSGGKKTRTKPIRNAEGVLIRKDGRPDMRSVSSANNLRKVHAKKEAERADNDGRTPTSARSLAPANSGSDEGDGTGSGSPGTPADGGEEEVDAQDTQERHHELMSRIFPTGGEGAGDTRSTAEQFFAAHDQHMASESTMKAEPLSEGPAEPQQHEASASQMTDVVMREMSEAQAKDHALRGEDVKMPIVEEQSADARFTGAEQAAAAQAVA